MGRTVKNRSLVLLGVCSLVLASGSGVLAGFGFWMLFGKPAVPLLMPGTATVELTEPGPHMIAYETQSVVNGQVISSPATPPNFEVKLTDPNGAAVAVLPPSSSYTYTIGGRSGHSIYEFTAAAPGRYELTARTPEAEKGQSFVLAVGPHEFWPSFLRIFGGACGTLAFGAVGVVILLIALGRWFESRDKRKRESGALP